MPVGDSAPVRTTDADVTSRTTQACERGHGDPDGRKYWSTVLCGLPGRRSIAASHRPGPSIPAVDSFSCGLVCVQCVMRSTRMPSQWRGRGDVVRRARVPPGRGRAGRGGNTGGSWTRDGTPAGRAWRCYLPATNKHVLYERTCRDQ